MITLTYFYSYLLRCKNYYSLKQSLNRQNSLLTLSNLVRGRFFLTVFYYLILLIMNFMTLFKMILLFTVLARSVL